MKMPNGYGSVTKLSGNRRKPWIVRITQKDGKIVVGRSVLGYYASKKDALQALAEYNDSPFNLTDNNLTFEQAYKKWAAAHYDGLSDNTIASRESAFKKCEPIYDIKMRNINLSMMQEIVDDYSCMSNSTQNGIKTVMSSAFEYAISVNLCKTNPATHLVISRSDVINQHTPFSDQEIDILWKHADRYDIQLLLILIYSGMRVNEFLKNTKDNINLTENWIYIPKAKNKSSVRYVPIHPRIRPILLQWYDRADNFIATNMRGSTIIYRNFIAREFSRINEEFDFDHNFHDTRHTFATLAHRYHLDELTTQKILGHTPDSITKKIYTHISIEDMQREIAKIK